MSGDLSAGDVDAENVLLRRVIDTITSNVELEGVLHSMVELVMEATGGDACFLHLWEPDEECLVLRAASLPYDREIGKVRLALGEGVAGWVAANRDVVVIPDDKWADPRYKYVPELHGELFRSMLSVPVVSNSGALVGVFNVHSRERRDFASREIEFLRLTGSLIAGAIEHANLFRVLAEKEAALQVLVRKTIEVQEEERRRVATEIHDGVTQQLVSVWYRLQATGRSLRAEPDRAERELAAALDLVDEALAEARIAIYDLRPAVLDDLGLSAGLRTLAMRQLEGEVELELGMDEVHSLPPHLEVALYRIAQEAITNIRKHAGASRVSLTLHEEDDHVDLVIEDNGRGFDQAWTRPPVAQTAFGLTGMTERADLAGGRLTIQSVPGQGTILAARIPTQGSAART